LRSKSWILKDGEDNYLGTASFTKIFGFYGSEKYQKAYCTLLQHLPKKWREDLKFSLILQALLLHWPERDGIQNKEAVKKAFDFYKYLLYPIYEIYM